MPGQLIYTWKQTDDTVLISVAIPDGIDQQKLDITITDLFVKFIYASQKLQIDLIHEVDPFQSTYSIDVPGKNVNLTLKKGSSFSWHKLLWKGYPNEVKKRRDHSMNRYARKLEYLQQQQQSEKLTQMHEVSSQILAEDAETQVADSPPEHEESQHYEEEELHIEDVHDEAHEEEGEHEDEEQHTEDAHEGEAHEESNHESNSQSESKSKKKKKKKNKKKAKLEQLKEEKLHKEKDHSSDEEKHEEHSPEETKHHAEHSKRFLLPVPLPAVSPLKSAVKKPISRHQKEKAKWNQQYNGAQERHVHFDDSKNLVVDFGKYDTIAMLAAHVHALRPHNDNHVFPDPDAHLFKNPPPTPPSEPVEEQHTNPQPSIESKPTTDNNKVAIEPPKASETLPEAPKVIEESSAAQKAPEEVSGDASAPSQQPKKKKKNKKKNKQPGQLQPESTAPVVPPSQPPSTQQQPSLNKAKQPKPPKPLENADDIKLKANEAVKKGEYKTAINLFTDAIAVSNAKQIVPNLLNRALCHLTLLQHDQCVEDTTAALKLLHCLPTIPPNLDLYTKNLAARAFVRRGAALCWSGRALEAEKDFEKAIELAPDDSEIRDDLISIQEAVRQHVMQLKQEGDKFFMQQQFQGALMMYTRCVNLLPTDARLFLNRALCYYNTSQFSECIADCDKSLEILTDPNTPQDPQYVSLLGKLFVRRGSAHLRLHDLHSAAKDYQNALRMEPNNADLKEDLKRIYTLIKLTN